MSMQGINQPEPFAHIAEKSRIGVVSCTIFEDLGSRNSRHFIIIIFEKLVAW